MNFFKVQNYITKIKHLRFIQLYRPMNRIAKEKKSRHDQNHALCIDRVKNVNINIGEVLPGPPGTSGLGQSPLLPVQIHLHSK